MIVVAGSTCVVFDFVCGSVAGVAGVVGVLPGSGGGITMGGVMGGSMGIPLRSYSKIWFTIA